MPITPRKTIAVILAAGKGIRMKSKLPKVLTHLMGRPIISFVIDACQKTKVDQILLVIGHQAELVRETFGDQYSYVEQKEQLGTGHALMIATSALKKFHGDLLVLAGDTPLLTSQILKKLVSRHQRTNAAATMMTAIIDPPLGYGRIIRNPSGQIQRIVEARDATSEEKQITEVNTSHYCFKSETVLPLLSKLKTDNDQGEYYLTDIIEMLVQRGDKVESITSDDPNVLLGINNRTHLSEIHQILQKKIIRKLMDNGVTIVDPNSVYIEPDVKIRQDTIIYPFTSLLGKTIIKQGCSIGPQVKLMNARIGEQCKIQFTVIENRTIENGAVKGPFAYISGE